MPKPKSLTILGVRGLRIHERTPYTPGVWALAEGEQCKVAEQFKAWEVLARDAAVQVMLWEQDRKYTPKAYDSARYQSPKWQEVFNRAMRRYEADCKKENKR